MALHDMQRGKCCYCENYIPNGGGGQEVEHYWPKSICECHRNEWTNLLLACGECNRAKWDQFPMSEDREPLLLDPSDPDVDPEHHIEFFVSKKQSIHELPQGFALPRGHSTRGKESIRVVKLYGEHHLKRRREVLSRLRLLHQMLRREVRRLASGSGDAEEIGRLKNELLEACGDDKAYAGLARTFYRVYQVEGIWIR